MKVIAKKFRGVWHYDVITSVVTEWVLEIYGGATQWRAVFEDGDTVDLLRSEEEEEEAHLRAWESAAMPGSDTNALTFAVMKCSAHVKSKNFNNSADSDWQLLHAIMPAGFTWGGMAVPRSHKAMRKFLRVPDTSRYVRHMCPKGCVAFSGAPGKAGGWANLPDQHCPECNADSTRKVQVQAADGGDPARGVRAKCKCKLLVAGIHARSQDAPSHQYRRRHPTPAALTTNRHVSFGRRFIRVGASAGLGVCRRQSCEAMDTVRDAKSG
eukprot:jgi/Tetstr1/447109/TSEL_034547.t1